MTRYDLVQLDVTQSQIGDMVDSGDHAFLSFLFFIFFFSQITSLILENKLIYLIFLLFMNLLIFFYQA